MSADKSKIHVLYNSGQCSSQIRLFGCAGSASLPAHVRRPYVTRRVKRYKHRLTLSLVTISVIYLICLASEVIAPLFLPGFICHMWTVWLQSSIHIGAVQSENCTVGKLFVLFRFWNYIAATHIWPL